MFFKEVFRISLISSVGLVVLAACTSTPEPIQTVERFNSRVDDKGLTQFAYGISWKNSQLDSSFTRGTNKATKRSGKRDGAEAALRVNDKRFAQLAGKETKLELEDKAALGLSNKLKNKGLCANGHVIKQVIWENGRIRLMGNCL